jgi:nitrite reductase/ring-hydroxylating ferredoxin subunit
MQSSYPDLPSPPRGLPTRGPGSDAVHAFVNACPHQYLPLDHRGDSILSADGAVIRCTNHGAGFCFSTGHGVEGLGIDQKLDVVPVRIDELGRVVIDDRTITADTADNNGKNRAGDLR